MNTTTGVRRFYSNEEIDLFAQRMDEYFIELERLSTLHIPYFLPPVAREAALDVQNREIDFRRKVLSKHAREIISYRALASFQKMSFQDARIATVIVGNKYYKDPVENLYQDSCRVRSLVSETIAKNIHGVGDFRSGRFMNGCEPSSLWMSRLPEFLNNPSQIKRAFLLPMRTMQELRCWVFDWSEPVAINLLPANWQGVYKWHSRIALD